MVDEQPEATFRLHLASELDGLYLDVPVETVASLCRKPVKYLRFLAYCILGVDGLIASEEFEGDELADDERLGPGVYYFVRAGDEDALEHAVDPEALTYSHAPETTNTRENFRTLVAERDVACIFTNTNVESCQGVHIVPFSRGDEWMKEVVQSRIPEDNEDVSNLSIVNDIRNGMLVSNVLHPVIDKKKLVVLKTPNLILDRNDIPPRSNNADLLGGVKYSTKPHYTLQWLEGTEHQRRDIPNNMDAAFKTNSKKPKPSALLLNYNYGVAALKWWGKGPEHLLTARKRPTPPIAAPLGPSRIRHDREVTTGKLDDARKAPASFAGGQDGSGGNNDVDDIDERRQSDAERLVLTLYASAPAARDRRAKQRAEREHRMVEWQSGVRMALET
ncbi:hypothetical protein C8F04DRAFT_987884 [Mycena alexandri]|uniref:HNH nuclease domain-containing protein n=1 Tax=Mycena alexandri TaxID=1745969 RepID=A0AAD6TL35_9AGAR|nr:hypothetical protein C8F04DRAFT_987884 [Mycena alexandri]